MVKAETVTYKMRAQTESKYSERALVLDVKNEREGKGREMKGRMEGAIRINHAPRGMPRCRGWGHRDRGDVSITQGL